MTVNDKQIDQVLNDDPDSGNHWIFNHIIEDQYLFTGLRLPKERIRELHSNVLESLNNFDPFNKDIFDLLFKDWNKILNKVDVEMVAGCPEIYDMMVRNGIMVIDIQNIAKYLSSDYTLDDLLSHLLTHEFIHLCIDEDYTLNDPPEYLDRLDYLMFQEGFAHSIPYFYSLDVSQYQEHYQKACIRLEEVQGLIDVNKQEEALIEADIGEYWSKFGAIAAKMYILNNKDNIKDIYKEGYKDFHEKVLKDYKQGIKESK